MRRVFISYAHHAFDREKALHVYNDLKSAGHFPWLDELDLLPGADWASCIAQEIRAARQFIALLSSRSLNKQGFVQKELRLAFDVLDTMPVDQRFVIPVRLDECHPMDDRIARLHWADLFPDYQAGMRNLLKSLGHPENTERGLYADVGIQVPADIASWSDVRICEFIHDVLRPEARERARRDYENVSVRQPEDAIQVRTQEYLIEVATRLGFLDGLKRCLQQERTRGESVGHSHHRDREVLRIRVASLAARSCPAIQELVAALEYVGQDPAASLVKSRVVLETLMRKVFELEDWQRPDKQRMVGQLLLDHRFVQRLHPDLHAAMKYVNTVAGADGAHPGHANTRKAGLVLDHLCDILEWFVEEYSRSGLHDNFGEVIEASDYLLLYMSAGGTDRCAMANVLTRHRLMSAPQLRRLRPMSAALHTPAQAVMTDEAVQVVQESIGKMFRDHRTIKADERYVRRADLILAMDAKILAQMPTVAAGKAHLFTRFFGSFGNIGDPYGYGLEVYRRRFRRISRLITNGWPRLEEVAQPISTDRADPFRR